MSQLKTKFASQPEPSGRAGAYLIIGVLFAAAALADVFCRCWP